MYTQCVRGEKWIAILLSIVSNLSLVSLQLPIQICLTLPHATPLVCVIIVGLNKTKIKTTTTTAATMALFLKFNIFIIYSFINVPFWRSSSATLISSSVFITIGPLLNRSCSGCMIFSFRKSRQPLAKVSQTFSPSYRFIS
jgi:hypothetical protein